MVTNQQLLEAARSALHKRLNGDAYESYRSPEMQFIGTPLIELQQVIQNLEQSVAAESGGGGFLSVEGVQ